MKRRFVLLALTAALLPSLPGAADPGDGKRSPLPVLPDFEGYKVDPYLDAAVELQALGKEKAAGVLTDLAAERHGPQAIILCRMLFQARPVGTFRAPMLGVPGFVSEIEAKDREAVCKDWPRQPIDLVDGVPFLVVEGHFTTGRAETSRQYVDYCVRHLDWNVETFGPKTAEEKRVALTKLEASPRWKGPLKVKEKEKLSFQIEAPDQRHGPRAQNGRRPLFRMWLGEYREGRQATR